MDIYNNFVGIDIGKHEFVVNVYGSKKTYPYTNNLEGLEKLNGELGTILQNALIVLEVTGGYERSVIAYLQQKNIAVHRANGRQIKSFIRSYGIVAKNDNIDAIALSQYAFERQSSLKIYQVSKHDFLRELNERRNDLVKMRTQEKNRSQAPCSNLPKNSFTSVLNVLDEQINVIEKQMEALIASDAELTLKIKELKTISGIGNVLAHALIAQMPELGELNQKQAASLAGVAPHPNQSGTKNGYRRTRGGRRSIKALLFMGALSAVRSKSKLGDFYNRLISNGKSKLCALVAVIRKMVVIANAKIKAALALRTQTSERCAPC
jgi:transposase